MTTEVIKMISDISEKVTALKTEHNAGQKAAADRIDWLEMQASKQNAAGLFGGGSNVIQGLGQKVWLGVSENSDLLSKTDKLRLSIKAGADLITTTQARTVVSAGLGGPTGAVIGIQNALTSRVIGNQTAVEYSRFLAVEGAAALQATEGDLKGAVRPTFSLINQPTLTVAGWAKVSKQALSDVSEMTRAVDVTLRRAIGKALDAQLTGGAWGGLLTLATSYTSLVYTGLADAASEGVASMQEAGFVPDTVVMRPADWLALTTVKSTTGEYLSGSYLAPLPELLRGLKVVLSPTITAGKVMVLDSSQIELLIVEDMAVEVGLVDDDFTRNVRTILGEMRFAPTFRSVGAAKLITPKA